MEDRASVRGIPPTAGWAPSQGVGTGPTRGGKRPTSVRPVPLHALPEPFLLSRTGAVRAKIHAPESRCPAPGFGKKFSHRTRNGWSREGVGLPPSLCAHTGKIVADF